MHRVLLGALLFANVFLLGCGNYDYQKTKQNLVYKIFREGKGDQIVPGTFLKIHFDAVVDDSILFSNFGKIPAYGRYDSMPQPAYDFLDFLGEMRVGDSAVYVRSLDTLVSKGFLTYGGRIKRGGTIIGHLRVVQSFASDTMFMGDQLKEMEALRQRESDALESWLKSNNVTGYQKLKDGVFMVVHKEGAGAKADSGKLVKVNYTGRLKDGTVFDSNIDSTFGHVEPLQFTVGMRQVIPGWDVALQAMKVGTSATVYIPSMMAYGMQGGGEKIPPYTDLIFDIELLEVSEPNPGSSGTILR